MTKLLLVGLGGFIGSIARYVLSGAMQQWLQNSSFPYGTMAVNIIGCFAIGCLNGLAESRQIISPEIRVFLVVGLLGGFTTFSTFGYETFMMISEGDYLKAIVNVMAHIVFGVALVWGGYFVTTLK